MTFFYALNPHSQQHQLPAGLKRRLLLDSSPAAVPHLIHDTVEHSQSISSEVFPEQTASQQQVRQHQQEAIPGEPSPKTRRVSVSRATTACPNTSHMSSTDSVTAIQQPDVCLFHEHHTISIFECLSIFSSLAELQNEQYFSRLLFLIFYFLYGNRRFQWVSFQCMKGFSMDLY